MKKIVSTILLLFLAFTVQLTAMAHSGRTDSSGGHKDNRNVSGLGSYHYHHGYGPHLHSGGICPYSPKDTISVDNMPSSMKIGDEVILSWTVTYHSGSSSVKWSSSDNDVVAVVNSRLTAKGEGTATITADLKNGSRTFKVKVTPIYAENVIIQNPPERLEVGSNTNFTAIVEPENATNTEITWSSSNSKIAAVDENGLVSALAVGKVTITATNADKKKGNVTFEVFEIYPEEIIVDNSEIIIPLSQTVSIGARLLPEDVTIPDMEWSSSDDTVVSVVEGQLTANCVGEAIITIKCQNVTTSVHVTVHEVKAEAINVNVTALTLDMNETQSIFASVLPEDTSNPTIIMTSNNRSIVEVGSDGLVVPKAAGITSITVSCDEVAVEIPVEVYIAAKALSIDADAIAALGRLKKGDVIDVGVFFEPQNTTYTDYELTSNNADVAIISGTAIEVVGYGTVGITATSGLISDSIEIEVKSNAIALLGGGALVGIGGVCAIILGYKRKKVR